jgi:hypothetical protein
MSAQIGRQRPAGGDRFDGLHELPGRRFLAQEFEPCTGSNIEGNFLSQFRFAEGAMPMPPAMAGPRSERMSPNRLLPTTTSNQSGCITK